MDEPMNVTQFFRKAAEEFINAIKLNSDKKIGAQLKYTVDNVEDKGLPKSISDLTDDKLLCDAASQLVVNIQGINKDVNGLVSRFNSCYLAAWLKSEKVKCANTLYLMAFGASLVYVLASRKDMLKPDPKPKPKAEPKSEVKPETKAEAKTEAPKTEVKAEVKADTRTSVTPEEFAKTSEKSEPKAEAAPEVEAEVVTNDTSTETAKSNEPEDVIIDVTSEAVPEDKSFIELVESITEAPGTTEENTSLLLKITKTLTMRIAALTSAARRRYSTSSPLFGLPEELMNTFTDEILDERGRVIDRKLKDGLEIRVDDFGRGIFSKEGPCKDIPLFYFND